MKKVMVGILILIPILILVVVAAISNFLKIAAWIAVDDISVIDKVTEQEVESLSIEFSDDELSENKVHSFYDYVTVKVMPDYANRYSIEWRISGDVECMSERYQKEYDKYLEELEAYNKYLDDIGALDERIRVIRETSERERKELNSEIARIEADDSLDKYDKEDAIEELQYEFEIKEAERNNQIKSLNAQKDALVEPDVIYVAPPAMLVDDNGNEVASNTSGKFVINSYCRFNIIVQVESITRTFTVTVEGYNVESITIANVGDDDSTIAVGEKMRVVANYTPMSSIVTETRWHSDNPSVATVDQNGVITAHGIGSANITVEANRYDNKDEFVTSETYTVNVVAGVSKFGTQFSTSKNEFKLSDIGVAYGDVTDTTGCEINTNTMRVILTADVATIETNNGTITINKCDENDIVIENADIYSATSGYVFAVSELTLKLRAVWKDVLKEGAPDGVVWTANSENNVATVENGEVTANESGLVEISASKDGKSYNVVLNVQIKVVSMKLRTGNDHLAVGLALETVFAAERYKNVSVNNEKEANSVLLQIVGAPKREEADTDATYKAKLAVFYNAFKFEIIEGAEYAHFSEDGAEPNRLIFNPSALEGKDKQTLKIKVSAKYPKYESMERFTTETVDINVIYGVEVNNIAEFRQAGKDQDDYAHAEGNWQDREVAWEHTNTANGRHDKYRYYDAPYSLRTYAISAMDDLRYEDEFNPDGTQLEITDNNSVKVYGNVYGNGHRLSAERNQVRDVQAMLWIAWSNVTVSNLNIRANKMEKDGTLSSDETSGLKGECFQIFSNDNSQQNRLTNVRVEFGIIENARRAGQAYNADYTLDGLVIRNIDSTAFYVPARMNPWDENGEYVTYPLFSHVNLNNCVFSNCIGTTGSYSYERFTVMTSGGESWNPFTDCDNGDGRFVRKDPVANAEYFKEHFISAGVNTQIKQTGFLDIYNWQNVQNANLIDTGDKNTNELIGMFAGPLLRHSTEFAKCRYTGEDGMYFHMGFLSTGISFGDGLFDEPVYLDVSFEDTRFNSEPIRTYNLSENTDSMPPEAALGVIAIKVMQICFYGYSDKTDITPYSTYEINADFIARLHKTAE